MKNRINPNEVVNIIFDNKHVLILESANAKNKIIKFCVENILVELKLYK